MTISLIPALIYGNAPLADGNEPANTHIPDATLRVGYKTMICVCAGIL